MKICIIGASGKLGTYMVQHALDRGHEVVGVCREQQKVIVTSKGGTGIGRIRPTMSPAHKIRVS